MAQYNSWSVYPSTKNLYNKRTVGLIESVSHWGEGVVVIVEKYSRTSKSGIQTEFFVSHGGFEHFSTMVGKGKAAHHDQTGATKGYYTVINVVEIKSGEIIKKVNDSGLDLKASMSVFK